MTRFVDSSLNSGHWFLFIALDRLVNCSTPTKEVPFPAPCLDNGEMPKNRPLHFYREILALKCYPETFSALSERLAKTCPWQGSSAIFRLFKIKCAKVFRAKMSRKMENMEFTSILLLLEK